MIEVSKGIKEIDICKITIARSISGVLDDTLSRRAGWTTWKRSRGGKKSSMTFSAGSL